MPCLPTKFCKRNWTQSLCKFLGVNKLYYGQMGKWWTFPTVPLPPPPHLKPKNLCLSDFREQNVWNMAILSYTVCMFLLSIYFKILNNNQYLKSLMSASTKCIAWDQAPQLGKRQKKNMRSKLSGSFPLTSPPLQPTQCHTLKLLFFNCLLASSTWSSW